MTPTPAPRNDLYPYAECREDSCPLGDDCCLLRDHEGPCEPTSHLVGAVVQSLRSKRLRPRSCRCGLTARRDLPLPAEGSIVLEGLTHSVRACVPVPTPPDISPPP